MLVSERQTFLNFTAARDDNIDLSARNSVISYTCNKEYFQKVRNFYKFPSGLIPGRSERDGRTCTSMCNMALQGGPSSLRTPQVSQHSDSLQPATLRQYSIMALVRMQHLGDSAQGFRKHVTVDPLKTFPISQMCSRKDIWSARTLAPAITTGSSLGDVWEILTNLR